MMIKTLRTFAQVMLVVILTVFLSMTISFVSPELGMNLLNNVVNSVPMFEFWVDILVKFDNFDLTNLADIYIKCFFEAMILGLCMTTCKKISDFLHIMRILPFGKILVTFIGVVVGTFVCSIMGDESGLALAAIGMLAVYGMLYLISSILPIHPTLYSIVSLKDFFIIIANSFVSVILMGYIASLHLYIGGSITIYLLISIAVLTIVSLCLLYLIDGFGE